MDNSINNLDWNSYKNLYDLTEHPTVRTFHWSPLFYKTNNEYIFQPQALADRVDEGFIGGEGAYGSTGSQVGKLYAAGNMGMNNAPKLHRPEVIGYDVPYEKFVDISKPLNQQSEYIQKAVEAYRNSLLDKDNIGLANYEFWNKEGSLNKLPEIANSNRWNALMDELYPHGVLGIYDNEGLAGERNTFVYRHVKDMPKGYSAGRGELIEPNIAPELFGDTPKSIQKLNWENKMKDVTLPSIEQKYVNPVGIDTHLSESIPPEIKYYYYQKAEDILSNTLSDDNLKLMSRIELEDKKNILSRELIMEDYMKSHPEGLEIYKPEKVNVLNTPIPEDVQKQLDTMIDNILVEDNEPIDFSKLNEPKLSTPARSITKQTPKPQVQVKQPTITPKQVDIPIGARLYEAGLNPKELVKLAKDPKVLSEVTKSLGKAITNPKTYLELGRGLVSPTNIGLIVSDILVNKADQALYNRLKDKYNIKSQTEFNKLYPTLSTFERGQLGNTYPEMYQSYMKGR